MAGVERVGVLLLAAVAGANVLAGCGDEAGAPGVASQGEALGFGFGRPAPIDSTNRFSGVVRLEIQAGPISGFCTGTLVNCRDVVTAQHCLPAGTTNLRVVFVRHDRFEGRHEEAVDVGSPVIGTNVFLRRPELGAGVPPFEDGDLMVVRLPPGRVPSFARPHRLHTEDWWERHGDNDVVAVGYGEVSACDVQPTGDRRYGEQRSATIDYVPGSFGGSLFWPRTSVDEAGQLAGDSGGPVMYGKNPNWSVAGILSTWIGSPYGCHADASSSASIAGNLDFLESVLAVEQDADGDGVADSCDRCAGRDDLDLCPDEAASPNQPRDCTPCGCNDRDDDLDGLCNSEDACPLVASAATANTNLVSELVHTPDKIWPDVCDPVPTPASVALPEESVVEDLGCSSLYCAKIYRTLRNRVDLTPVRSNADPYHLPGFVEVPGVDTHARFCTEGAGGPPCMNEPAIDDNRLLDALALGGERVFHPYHRITVVYPQNPLASLLVRGYAQPLDYVNAHANDATSVTRTRWLHQWDYDFWRARGPGFIALPAPSGESGVGTAAGLDGVLWMHAATDVGTSPVTGIGFHGEELTNSHVRVRPEQRSPRQVKLYRTLRPYVIHMWPDPPVPGDLARVATWADRPAGEARYALFDTTVGALTMLAASGEEYDIGGALGGGLRASLAELGSVVAQAAEPLRYTARNATTAVILSSDATRVVDTVAQLRGGGIAGGADDRGVACPPGKVLVECADVMRCAVPCDGAVGNDPDAGIAEDPSCLLAAAPANEGLTDESDFACRYLGDPPGRCGAGELACASSCFAPCDGEVGCSPNGQFSDEQPELCGAGAGSAAASITLPGLPEARRGFAASYSTTLDQVFVAGGTDAAGAEAGDVWVGRPRGHFVQLAPRGTLGRALALTYVAREAAVYALHERRGPAGLARVVLSRLDAFSGRADEVGSWVRLGLYDRFDLVADRDGSLLVTGSSERRDRHVIVRLELRARRVTALVRGAGRLFARPVVDDSGYLVVSETRSGAIRYAHPRTLGGAGCAWGALGRHL